MRRHLALALSLTLALMAAAPTAAGKKPEVPETVAESPAKAVVTGAVLARIDCKAALVFSGPGGWRLGLFSGPAPAKGYLLKGQILFKAKPAPGTYTLENLSLADLLVANPESEDLAWASAEKTRLVAFSLTLTAAGPGALHGSIKATLPPQSPKTYPRRTVDVAITF